LVLTHHPDVLPQGDARRWPGRMIFPHHKGRTPAHGYAATREAAMVAFAKSWRRE